MGSPSRGDLHRSRRRLRRALAVPLAGLVLAGGALLGAVEPAAGQESDDDTRAGKAEWTFMTYMVADNNLEPDALDDLLEMADAGSNPNVNVVAFIDRSDEFSEEPVGDLDDFTTAKLIHIQDGELEEIEDFGEVNSGSPQTLAWFIKTAIKMFPAKKYGLSLWDHGGGWQGYGSDDSAGGGMSIPDVVSAVSGGLRGAGVKKLEFLGFDACLMQTYEIAAAMQPFAKWFLASEEYEPAHGWDYHGLEAILDNPALKGKALGKSLIRSYIGQSEDEGTDAEVTLSLVNLKSMPKVVSALKGLVRAATADMEDVAQALATQGSAALAFGGAPEPSQAYNLIDLGDLLARLGEDVPDSVAVARASVYEALDRTVVAMENGTLYEQATGMAVYLPLYEEFYAAEGYAEIPDPAGWRSLLESYYEVAGEIAPPTGDFTFAGEPTLEVTPEGALITAQLPPGGGADVVAAFADIGIVDTDGSIIYLLSQPAVVGAGDADAIQSGWAYDYVLLSDGGASIPVFISLEPTETGFAAWAQVIYDGPSGGGEATLMLSLNEDFEVVGSTLYLFEENGTTSELTPEDGSTIIPLLLVVDPSGGFTFEPLGDGVLDGSGDLGIDIGTLGPGTPFVYGLTAYDVAGNSAFTAAEGVIP